MMPGKGPFASGPRYGGPKQGRPVRLGKAKRAGPVGTGGRNYLVGRSHGPVGQEIVGKMMKPQSRKLGQMHR